MMSKFLIIIVIATIMLVPFTRITRPGRRARPHPAYRTAYRSYSRWDDDDDSRWDDDEDYWEEELRRQEEEEELRRQEEEELQGQEEEEHWHYWQEQSGWEDDEDWLSGSDAR